MQTQFRFKSQAKVWFYTKVKKTKKQDKSVFALEPKSQVQVCFYTRLKRQTRYVLETRNRSGFTLEFKMSTQVQFALEFKNNRHGLVFYWSLQVVTQKVGLFSQPFEECNMLILIPADIVSLLNGYMQASKIKILVLPKYCILQRSRN